MRLIAYPQAKRLLHGEPHTCLGDALVQTIPPGPPKPDFFKLSD